MRPIEFMERTENRTIGICGIRLVDDTGASTISCARFPTPVTFFGHATGLNRLLPAAFKPHLLSEQECRSTREVDQIIGAFFLVRRDLFETLGGFDERFFVYFEEVDLALRARKQGFISVFLAESAACHSGSVSSDQVKDARLFYSLRSRLAYGRKHYTRLGNILLWAVTFGIEFPVRLGQAVVRRSWRSVRDTVRAYQWLVTHLWRFEL